MSTPVQAQLPRETNRRGAFVRQESGFRDRVTVDGSSGFLAEPGRYHLYVSLACPWAHRALVVRQQKGLEGVIGMTVVDPIRDTKGWAFSHEPDEVNGFWYLAEAYQATDPEFKGRASVPILWDKTFGVIVNNESSEIIRMLNSEFDAWGDPAVDLYPADLREEIDALNEDIYTDVNNGVYRAGFATTQAAYQDAIDALFEAFDGIDQRLATRRYLMGARITEADWRLFTTLIRFDAVYHGHFKCNLRRLVDYPNLWAYTRDLYQQPGIAATVDLDHIKRHYFGTHNALNPLGIIPAGPVLDLDEPHGREDLAPRGSEIG